MIKFRFLIAEIRNDLKCNYIHVVIVNDNNIHSAKNLALRAYNQHYVNYGLKGKVIARLNDYNSIIETYDEFAKNDAYDLLAKAYDNIYESVELSDLSLDGKFISVDKYLPEHVCLNIFGSGRTYTKDCICKLDDGTLKYSYRVSIDIYDYNDTKVCEKEINKWRNRISKFAYMPPYRWQMPKEYADRVVAWRFPIEGENIHKYN